MLQSKHPLVIVLANMLVPGLGHFLLGRKVSGLWASLFFYLAILGLFHPNEISSYGNEVLYTFCIKLALSLYSYLVIDSYFLSQRKPAIETYNPRSAFILNFLTRGFGYFYLERRILGVIAFIVIGATHRLNLNSTFVGICIEVGMIAIALHAYQIAYFENKKNSNTGTSPVTSDPYQFIAATLCVGTLCTAIFLYSGLFYLGATIPDYSKAHIQSQASIIDHTTTVSNQAIGLSLELDLACKILEIEEEVNPAVAQLSCGNNQMMVIIYAVGINPFLFQPGTLKENFSEMLGSTHTFIGSNRLNNQLGEVFDTYIFKDNSGIIREFVTRVYPDRKTLLTLIFVSPSSHAVMADTIQKKAIKSLNFKAK